MKKFIFNDTTYDTLPDPFHGVSPMTEQRFIDLGGTVYDDGSMSPEEEFAEAAAKFRALCDEIGAFISNPSFTGGFEEVAVFHNSRAAQNDPITAHALALQWMELNEECKYKGARIGLGQPEWFYRAWELATEEQTEA